jgi:formate dehydrogenase assembly factor FdhD
MPYCPTCKQEFPSDLNQCPHDRSELVAELPFQTITADDGTTWVEVASCGTEDEAMLMQGFFEAEGIAAQIENLKFSMEPINFGTMGDIRIYVKTEDQARAMELLRTRNREYDRLADDSETLVTEDGPAIVDENSQSEVETER